MAGIPHGASPRSAGGRAVRPVRVRMLVSMSFGPEGRDLARPSPLSDRGELSAGQFGVKHEAERIQCLALLHQTDHNRLPELGQLAAVGMAEPAPGEYFQGE